MHVATVILFSCRGPALVDDNHSHASDGEFSLLAKYQEVGLKLSTLITSLASRPIYHRLLRLPGSQHPSLTERADCKCSDGTLTRFFSCLLVLGEIIKLRRQI